jgi:phage terminase large subunit-like protein
LGSGRSRWYFDAYEADRVCRFFGKYLRHFEDEWAGKPFILEKWQRKFLRELFGWRDRKTGARKYRVAYLEVPRKNGKSTLAAGIALYLLICDGVAGAQVYSLAADATQAKIVFDAAKAMVEQNRALSRKVKVYRNSLFVKSTRSSYKVLSSDLKGKWGFNASGIIGDEIHALPNRKVWDALLTSRGTRKQPLVIAITTAGIYDNTSLCLELNERAMRLNDPKSGYKNERFLGRIYGAKRGEKWKSKTVWRKANPNLGATGHAGRGSTCPRHRI